MRYKLVLFDMDGTTLNTLDDLTDSMNYTLNYFNSPLVTTKEVASFLGNGMKVLTNLSFKGANVDMDKAYEIFSKHYKIHSMDKTKPYDGIVDLLTRLKKDGFKLALVSNKADFVVKGLVDDFFKDLFDYSIGQKDDVNKKPAPDMVNICLEKLNIDKKDSIYIGDTEVDINTARNANIDVIGVTYGFRSKEFVKSLNPTYLANDVNEIYKILTK